MGCFVTNLQSFLVIMGYLDRQYITGYFGPITSAALNAYIAAHPSTCKNGTSTATSTLPLFTRTLRIGSSGTDVKNLQIFLNAHGYTVSTYGPGAPGYETMYYGMGTAAAVSRFQVAHMAQILTPQGLARGNGTFDTLTMQVVNAMITAKQ